MFFSPPFGILKKNNGAPNKAQSPLMPKLEAGKTSVNKKRRSAKPLLPFWKLQRNNLDVLGGRAVNGDVEGFLPACGLRLGEFFVLWCFEGESRARLFV